MSWMLVRRCFRRCEDLGWTWNKIIKDHVMGQHKLNLPGNHMSSKEARSIGLHSWNIAHKMQTCSSLPPFKTRNSIHEMLHVSKSFERYTWLSCAHWLTVTQQVFDKISKTAFFNCKKFICDNAVSQTHLVHIDHGCIICWVNTAPSKNCYSKILCSVSFCFRQQRFTQLQQVVLTNFQWQNYLTLDCCLNILFIQQLLQ